MTVRPLTCTIDISHFICPLGHGWSWLNWRWHIMRPQMEYSPRKGLQSMRFVPGQGGHSYWHMPVSLWDMCNALPHQRHLWIWPSTTGSDMTFYLPYMRPQPFVALQALRKCAGLKLGLVCCNLWTKVIASACLSSWSSMVFTTSAMSWKCCRVNIMCQSSWMDMN